MTAIRFIILVTVFLVTSTISVVTGSTSVITVPVMFQFGIDSRVAVATNMFALTFMSLGGVLPFWGRRVLDRRRLPLLIGLTLAGSAAGAFALLNIPRTVLPVFVSTAIIGVAVFSTVYRNAGVDPVPAVHGRGFELLGYVLTLLLGIYGGVFSGGYVTILTAVFVTSFRMTFMEAVATTKLMNVFSSGIAAAIFMPHGVVDYRLGVVLGLTMFAGAFAGARFASQLENLWLRRIYLTAVWILGLKTLIFDVFKTHPAPVSLTPERPN